MQLKAKQRLTAMDDISPQLEALKKDLQPLAHGTVEVNADGYDSKGGELYFKPKDEMPGSYEAGMNINSLKKLVAIFEKHPGEASLFPNGEGSFGVVFTHE